jgi:hypothetical protein
MGTEDMFIKYGHPLQKRVVLDIYVYTQSYNSEYVRLL